MASYTPRKSGWIQAKIRITGHPSQSKTFKTKDEAKAWATIIESEILRGVHISTEEAKKNTIGDLIDQYRKDVLPNLKGNGTSPALNNLRKELGEYSAASLTSKLVAKYRDTRLKQASTETVRKEMATLSRVIDVAMREWGITLPSNPCSSVTRPSPGKSRDRRLLPGEEDRLLNALRKCRNPYVIPAFKFALESAARQGEILNLKRKDIYTEKGLCVFYDTKNGEDRAAPLSPAAINILNALPKKEDDVRAFPISANLLKLAYSRSVERARATYVNELKKAGKTKAEILTDTYLTDLTFHDLRHEAVSRFAERGDLSLLELSEVSGHKTLQMLKRYTHLQAERISSKLANKQI